MVIIYKVLARYNDGRGHSYTEIGYYLSRSKAYQVMLQYMDKRGRLSSVDKILVQEISIGPEGAGIRNVDFICEASDTGTDQ